MIELAMLVLPGAFHGGIAALMDGFALASERRERIVRDEKSPDIDMRLTVLSRDGRPIELCRRVTIAVDRAIASTDRFDFVWIPSFRVGGDKALSQRLGKAGPETRWLARQARQGAVVGASGSAQALVLAAGLARDLAIPVVPALAPTFRTLFPRVRQDEHREIVDRGNLLLGSGTSTDLELVARAFDRVLSPSAGHWLRSVLGHEVITREAKAVDPQVETARLWLEQRFTGPVSIADLARELNIAQATLSRRFRAEMGLTPAAYVTQLRMTMAKRMLAQSRRSIESIAAMVGYNDARNFREIFNRTQGTSASEWRRRS